MVKDHIVPQTYLRGFASDGTGPPNYRGLKLWVFNKVSGHHSYASIESMAFENNFESLPPGHPDGPKVIAFAHKLHKKEDRWPQLRNRVGLMAERGRTIDRGLRQDLSDYMACQFVRTTTFRTLWRAGHEDLLARGVVPTPADVSHGRLTPDQTKVAHAKVFMGPTPEQIAAGFAAMSWLIGVNTTTQPFFTSDNPVAWGLSPHRPSNFIYAFPITSKLILVMNERNGDCTETLADDDLVLWYNKFQINFCHRRVFCSVDHSGDCRRHCFANPHVCDPDIPEKAGVAMANNDYSKSIAAHLAALGR